MPLVDDDFKAELVEELRAAFTEKRKAFEAIEASKDAILQRFEKVIKV